jgi:NADP-dependent 3-hydroxy acid dehydrogenase YdfG
MTGTIAVIGAGPGLGRSVGRRFGREGFRVALVARSAERVEAFASELRAEGIEAAGFPADIGGLAGRTALPGLVSAITARFGPIDVLQYAPAGPDWMSRQTDVRECDAQSFEFPLDLLLRTPVELIREVLPGMLARDRGAVLFGLPATAVRAYPQLANAGAAAAAARAYLECLHVSLAGTGVYAGLLLVGGMVGDSDSARAAAEKWGAQALPEPLDPADLAAAVWNLHHDRDRFETLVS